MNKIQVSTIAKPRDEYTSKFNLNTQTKKEWIAKKPSIFNILRFQNQTINPSDYYAPISKTYRENDIFIAGREGCVIFVLCVGASGYGTQTKGYGTQYPSTWSDPVGGWQIDDKTDDRTQIYDKVLRRTDYVHNPPQSLATPSSFGSYLSANAGLNIAENTITQYQNYRTWTIRGWESGWDWGNGQYRYRSETQNIKLSSGAFDGDLLGSDAQVRFGVFRLAPNEVVPISVGKGFVNGHIDIVYFELRNGNNEAISKPSNPNDVTQNIPTTPPKEDTQTPPVILPLTLAIKPDRLELERGTKETIEIITNAPSFTSNMQDDTIASFDETTKEITANLKGDTMLIIEAVRDNETIRRAVAIKVIEKEIITPPTQPEPEEQTEMINVAPYRFDMSMFNIEELSYLYVLSLAFSEFIAIATNENLPNVIFKPFSQEKKAELQTIYDTYRVSDPTMRTTLEQYGLVLLANIGSYINLYQFVANRDEAHLESLKNLIQEKIQVIEGIEYNYELKDFVKNMDHESLVTNITIWVKELDKLITRNLITEEENTSNVELNSLDVIFSKEPNSYITRNETKEELKVESFNQTWNDPIDTDYIHELYFFIIYAQAGVNYTMQQVKETWALQKNTAGDNNVSNTPEKRQDFINIKPNVIGEIFIKAYETDMKDELFETYEEDLYKMRLKESIYTLSNKELIELFTKACQRVYAINKG
ncbi:hypothetical protein [Helicobacter trogontum]|uniref:Uncharacterized protein n=1 Tax=Helicobacter trogontum TaxID=50960 RepID=A0A4U8SDM2_9HELI|nr:hypothetical protein [Helicobacter trogontum]TLD84243.1 hypothetical protein LS81_001905 [Helicobacter trogontum]